MTNEDRQKTKRVTSVKHLVQCHCVLPQFRHKREPVFHQFAVFSVIDENDAIASKYVKCNNCSALHLITEIGKSEIAINASDDTQVTTIDDIKLTLPDRIRKILETHDADQATWEECQHICDNKLWGATVTLRAQQIGDGSSVKTLKIDKNRVSVKNHARKDVTT